MSADSESDDIIYNDDNSSLNPDNSFAESSMVKANEVMTQDKEMMLQSPEFKLGGDGEQAEGADEEVIENDANGGILNKNTINLAHGDSREEFDVIKEQEELPALSTSPIKKKQTIIDDVSLNVKLKNNNESIDMEHFDEASKIGFGLHIEDDPKQKVEVLNKDKDAERAVRGSSLMKLVEKDPMILKEAEIAVELPPQESPYKKLLKQYEHEPVLDFPFLRISNQIELQKELQSTRTFNKFIKHKIRHYTDTETLEKEIEHKQKRTSLNEKRSKRPVQSKAPFNPFKTAQPPIEEADSLLDNNYNSEGNAEMKKSKAASFHQKFNTLATEVNATDNDIKSRRLIKENNALREKISELSKVYLQLQQENDFIDEELLRTNEKLTAHLDKYDSLNQENDALRVKLENMQVEYSIEENEIQKKIEKLAELQKQYDLIDKEYQMSLKKHEIESSMQKETKKNFEEMKDNYTEMRSQYDLLNSKYQALADENFNFKREVLLFEQELKSKNEMIDKLRVNLLESAKIALNTEPTKDVADTMASNETSNSFPDASTRPNNFFQKEKGKIKKRVKTKSTLEEEKGPLMPVDTAKDNRDKSIKRIKALPKEEQIKQIEVKISKLSQEKDNVNSYLNRLPERLKKKDLIDKRSEMETKIEALNSELGRWRIEMKSLKVIDKD